MLVALAFILDITGIGSAAIPNSIFGVPSLLVALYYIGFSILVRFAIARRKVHLAITWPILIFLYFGWFIIWALLTDGEPYTPSLLFVICLVAAFRTLRFDIAKKGQDSTDGSNTDIAEI